MCVKKILHESGTIVSFLVVTIKKWQKAKLLITNVKVEKMKKILSLFFAVVLFSSLSFAQFNAGQASLGAILGVGGSGLTGSGAYPIGVEYNFWEYNKNLQLGAYAGFAMSTEEINYFFGKGTWTYTNILLGAQGNWHFYPGEKFDPFVGAVLGYNIASASWEWDPKPAGAVDPTVSVGGVIYSGQAGFNYWFSPKMAVQVKVGLLPYFGAGITYNM